MLEILRRNSNSRTEQRAFLLRLAITRRNIGAFCHFTELRHSQKLVFGATF